MGKKCLQCGKLFEEDQLFCDNCGQKTVDFETNIIPETQQKTNIMPTRKFYRWPFLLVYYILAIGIIILGFVLGNNYKLGKPSWTYTKHGVIDAEYIIEKHGEDYFEKLAEDCCYDGKIYENLLAKKYVDDNFDGGIFKRNGWYNFNWMGCTDVYQYRTDISDDEFRTFLHESGLYEFDNWENKDYINFVLRYEMSSAVVRAAIGMHSTNDCFLIKVNDKKASVPLELMDYEGYNSSNSNYYNNNIVKSIIFILLMLLLPIVVFIPLKLIEKSKQKKY